MAEYWVDPLNGSDANAGTVLGSPKKSLYSAFTAAAAGSSIHLAAGLCHPAGTSGTANDRSFVSSGGFIQGAGKAGIVVDGYDAGYGYDRPVLDGMAWSNPGDVGWSHVGSGVWKLQPAGASAYVRRLWIDSRANGLLIADRRLGTSARRCDDAAPGETPTFHATEAAVIAALTAGVGIWYGTSNNGDFSAAPWALYMYTGSTTVDPATFYGGIAWVQVGVSAANLVWRNGADGGQLRDVVVRGTAASYGTGIGNLSSGGIAGLLLLNVGIEAYGLSGLEIAAKGASGYLVSGVEVRNVTLDAKTSENEVELGANEFYEGIDDVEIGQCSGVSIRGLTVHTHASTHSGLSIGNLSTDATYQAVNVTVEDFRVVVPSYSRDARAFAVSRGLNTTLTRGDVSGGSTRVQIAGQNTRIISIVHRDLSTAGTQFVGNDVEGMWLIRETTGFASDNIRIENCTLDARNWAACGSALAVTRNTGGYTGPAPGTVFFHNNLSILRPDQSMFGVGVSNNTGPEFGTARDQTYAGNVAISADTTRAAQLCAYKTNDTEIHSYVDFAAVTAGVTAYASNAAAMLTAAGTPMPGSPLLNQGADLGYRRDIRGILSRRHVGAYGAARMLRAR